MNSLACCLCYSVQLSNSSYIGICGTISNIGDATLDWCCTAISIRHCSTHRNIRRSAVFSSLGISTNCNISIFCMGIVP